MFFLLSLFIVIIMIIYVCMRTTTVDRTYVCISHLHPPSLSLCSKFGWCDPAPGPFNQQFDRAYVCPSVCLTLWVHCFTCRIFQKMCIFFFWENFPMRKLGGIGFVRLSVQKPPAFFKIFPFSFILYSAGNCMHF